MNRELESKALKKIGVASELGTAVRPGPLKSRGASRAGALISDGKGGALGASAASRLIASPGGPGIMGGRVLNKKELVRMCAEKVVELVEHRKTERGPTTERGVTLWNAPNGGAGRGKDDAGTIVRQVLRELRHFPEAAVGCGYRPIWRGAPRTPASSRAPTAAASRSTTAAASRLTTAASEAGREPTASSGGSASASDNADRSAAGTPSAANAVNTAHCSDEIRIAQGEDVEWKQVVPMVLNLEDLERSTIEVLEYEAERPLVEDVPAPAAVVHE